MDQNIFPKAFLMRKNLIFKDNHFHFWDNGDRPRCSEICAK